jgi:hypothetical protein
LVPDTKDFTADLRADIEVFENLRVSGQANFSNQSSEQVDNVNWIFERAISLPPTTKYRFEDGTLHPAKTGQWEIRSIIIKCCSGKTILSDLHLGLMPIGVLFPTGFILNRPYHFML